MHTVRVEKEIPVPAQVAWEKFDDFGGIANFHPLVVHSTIVNDIETGMGAQRVCEFADGNAIREAVEGYRPGTGYSVRIVDPGKFPLKEAVAHITVEPVGVQRSRVTFVMQFRPKFGPLGWLMAKTMMAGQFRKILGRVIDGIEEHVRTGKVVGASRVPRAA